MSEDHLPDRTKDETAPKPARRSVSRRQFLAGAGVAGAAAILTPVLIGRHSDPAVAESYSSPDAEPVGSLPIVLNVNGESFAVRVEPRTTLLNALRNHLTPPLTGTKIVCDRGECGACTVKMDGKAVYSCMVLAADAEGHTITTVEGLSRPGQELHPVQAAFVAHDALMCGFCTPGFVMSVATCLENRPHASLDELRLACAGNTCRCGTYPRVFEAALSAARDPASRED